MNLDVAGDLDLAFARRTEIGSGDGLTAILAMAGRTDVISFAGGFPDPATFPGTELGDIFQRLLEHGDVSAMQYAPVAGLPGPREFLRERVALRQGHKPEENELMITSGTIEALELLGKALLDRDDLVFVEAPTYLGAIMAFQSFEANVVGSPMDREGLDVDALAESVEEHGRPKLLYVIPDHQNPAGVSLSNERRAALVHLAREKGFLIVEDVAYRELGFREEEQPSLYSLGSDVVLQAGTFSKTFFPGVRLGWATGPAAVVDKMVWAKQNTDQCAGALGQRLLEEYGREGGLERQAERARALYSRRCGSLMSALKEHMPEGVRWTEPQGGFFSWVTLPENHDATELARAAVEEGVAIVPGSPFFPDGQGSNNIRLSYSRVADEAIGEGISRLAALIRNKEVR
jgi:2-aminoadipate transaminase